MVPEQIKLGLQRYVQTGLLGGNFIHAVLTNDLVFAVTRAGPDVDVKEVVLYCCRELPASSWGSYEKVDAWVKKKQRKSPT